jgi:hypothetical protein
VTIGLCLVFASITVAARAQADSDEPLPALAPQGKETGVPRERYLMLTNGQLIKGILSETETECLVEQKIGTMRFPKTRIEGSFDTIRQAYEYRLAQLPERDSDESMKLALWCLNQKLSTEARELLTAILAKSPDHPKAKAMRLSIDQAAARLAHREREDPYLRQTRVEPMDEKKPDTLDAAILRNAQRGLGIKDLPVIFDLPLPLAIKRTEEFGRYVHPLLQAYCARCHDAQYEGKFQLVTVKSRADRTATALRANLDATLALVDSKNPSHSVLLSSTLRPHGKGARPRPIFPGSNDKAYMVLARWVNQLTAPKENDDPARRDASRVPTENDEVFAVERNRTSGARVTKGLGADTKMASGAEARTGGRATFGQPEAEPQEFPIPFAISGVKPNPAVPKKSSAAQAKQAAGTGNPKAPATRSTTGTGTAPDGDDDDADELPPPKPKVKSGASNQAPKTFKLDPKLLERTLQNRNANRQNQN